MTLKTFLVTYLIIGLTWGAFAHSKHWQDGTIDVHTSMGFHMTAYGANVVLWPISMLFLTLREMK